MTSHLEIIEFSAARYERFFPSSAKTLFSILCRKVLIDFALETSFWHRKWVLWQGWETWSECNSQEPQLAVEALIESLCVLQSSHISQYQSAGKMTRCYQLAEISLTGTSHNEKWKDNLIKNVIFFAYLSGGEFFHRQIFFYDSNKRRSSIFPLRPKCCGK